MIADTTFLIHFFDEGRAGRRGPARTFFYPEPDGGYTDNHYQPGRNSPFL